ncbi:MAG: cation diffusion facilitator family transporter [Clostridia bacterium]|nr:cation diffusion facilitator family transporter [Clostridia bacterium]
MKEFMWKTFVKDYENVKDPVVRNNYTKLTGTLGIIVNTTLSIIKIIIGLATHSIAVIADGAHDIADSLAACITLLGARLARKPADKNHPYGHARIEYLCGLVVSVIVVTVGFELMKSSVQKVIEGSDFEFAWSTVIIIVLAIIMKGSSALFTIATGKRINSLPVIAAGTDNRNDVISSIIIVISMLINYFTGLQLDGYMGCVVSLFILYSGYELTKETISPLLGEAPDPEMVSEIAEMVESTPGVLGIHDFIVHNYGPGKVFCSIHVEVDSKGDLMESHDMIDQIEMKVKKAMNIDITCHMDPVEVDNPVRLKAMEVIERVVDPMKEMGVESFHDLRVVPGPTHTNIIFDLVLTPGKKIDQDMVKDQIQAEIRKIDPTYFIVINFEMAYSWA